MRRLFLTGACPNRVPAVTTNDAAAKNAVPGIDKVFISRLTVVSFALIAVVLVKGDRVAAHAVHHDANISALSILKRAIGAFQALLGALSMPGDQQGSVGKPRQDQ